MVGRDLHPKEPLNTFPQVHPSPQHPGVHPPSADVRAAPTRRSHDARAPAAQRAAGPGELGL